MKTAVLLIAHGSRYAAANEDLHHLADRLREMGHEIVVPSFLELAEPGIEDGGRQCVRLGADRVVLTPFFLSPGIHVRRDLVQSREVLAAEFPEVEFLLAEPMGRHPFLQVIIDQRVKEALKDLSPDSQSNDTDGDIQSRTVP